MRASTLEKLRNHLRPGGVYRREDLLPWSQSVDRHLKELIADGTLQKLRTGGRQTVVVQHVNVADGGQAVIGTVNSPGRGVDEKTGEQPHALGYAAGETLRSENPEWGTLPVARDGER